MFVDSVQSSVTQTRLATLNNGRFPVSILHPDNRQALADQGYYDNWSSTDDSTGHPENQAKLTRRKQPKDLSAGCKRKLFRTSHGSWNLVENDESEGDRFSGGYSPLSANSSALLSFGSMSSDGGLTPSWNLHSGENVDNDKIRKETNTNVFLYPEITEKVLSRVDCEKWYTPPSSPSGFCQFDEIFLEKSEANSTKSAWSSSTLLDQSLNVSLGDDCVFENETEVDDFGNRVPLSSNHIIDPKAMVDGCGNKLPLSTNEIIDLRTKVKGHGDKVCASTNEITDPKKSITNLESCRNKVLSSNVITDTKNWGDTVSSFANEFNEKFSTNANIKPIILDESQRRDSFSKKKSVSFKDEAEFSEIQNSENERTENLVVSNRIEDKDLLVKENKNSDEDKVFNKRTDSFGKNFLEQESLNSNVSDIVALDETASHFKYGENLETIVTSPSGEADQGEVTGNHQNELTVTHTTEYQIQITFGDIICTKPCVTESFRNNCDEIEEIQLDTFYNEIKAISGDDSKTNIPVETNSSSDRIEENACKVEKINAELFKMASGTVATSSISHEQISDKNDIKNSSFITEKDYTQVIQEHGLCNATELNEVLQNEVSQSENRNNNCAFAIGKAKFKSDQSDDGSYVREKSIGCDTGKMAGLDQSESMSQKEQEMVLPVDLMGNFPDSSSILAQLGLSGGPGEETQSLKMVCGHSLNSSSINGASSRSPPHLPERRKLFFTSHHSPPIDESSNTDFLSQLNSDLGGSQSCSLNVLARTSSAQSDSSGFADVETDNMLDLDLKRMSTYMGSSSDSDMTLASSINTVLTRNIHDSSHDLVESSPLSVSTPSKSLNFHPETMDKCIGTDIQGLDLIFQVLTSSGEVYHPEQGEDTHAGKLSSLEETDSDSFCDNNDTDYGFSIWNEKSCRFHESSYCIIPTLYGSDLSLANNDNDSAQDLNGNPTPQKQLVSRYYIDMSPRKSKSSLETSKLSLKVEAGKVSLEESEDSSDSVRTTRLQDHLQSFHDELFDVRDDVEMSQDEDLVDEIEREEQNFSYHGDRIEIHNIPEEADYSLCNFSIRGNAESPCGMSTPIINHPNGNRFSSSSAHKLSVLNLSVGSRPGGHMTFSQCQAASTPEVKFQNTEEDEAAIFEYQKLASLINQPTVTKPRGLNAVTTPRFSGPTHGDHWRALQREQRLVEENGLMQQAVDRYKMELRHLENCFNAHYSKVCDMMTEEERDEIEELQLLRAEVYKEVCMTEKLILGRGTNLSLANQAVKRPLASLDVVHQMIELLKEQMYERTVVLDLDSSMEHFLDSSFSSPPLSPWEEDVSDLREEVRREQHIQQRELERSFEGLKVSLFDEVKKEIHVGTQSLYQELQAKDKKITAMQSEIRQLKRRRSLQTDMLPPR